MVMALFMRLFGVQDLFVEDLRLSDLSFTTGHYTLPSKPRNLIPKPLPLIKPSTKKKGAFQC